MSIISSAQQISLYAQLQSGGPFVINNSAGVWTNTGSKKMRFDTFTIDEQNDINTPTYKTGNRSPMQGARGRQGVSWTLSKPFIPSGTAGTAPDDDPILQAIMGAANTEVASTSVTYGLGETLYALFLTRYNKTPGASSPTNTYVVGGIPQTVKFTGGGNFLQMEVEGVGVAAGDSTNFSTYTGGDLPAAGGLTAYPAEPTGLTTAGNVIGGFGSGAFLKIGGSALAEFRNTIELSLALGVDVFADAVPSAYLSGFVFGKRQISLSKIQCADSDGTVLASLKEAAFSKSPTAVILQFNNVAGSIVTFNLANVQFGSKSWSDNGAILDVSFGTSMAHQSTISAADDLTIVLS